MKPERICYWILIFGLIILIVNLKYCSGRKPCPTITEKTVYDTINKTDTFYTERPKPAYVKRPFTITDGITFNTSLPEAPLLTDTAEMVSDYLDIKGYSQQYTLPEGTIIVENEVHRNSLQNQMLITNFKNVVTTNYIVQKDTVEVPFSRNVILFGAGVFGNKTTAGVNVNLNWLTKKQAIYTAGWMQPFGMNGYFYVERKFPIRLRR